MRIITFGTYDLFHIGHYNILHRAKYYGGQVNFLIVGVSSDKLNIIKKKDAHESLDKRIEGVEYTKFADIIFVEESLLLKQHYVDKYKAELLIMGDDWKGHFDWVSIPCVYLPRTENISTMWLNVIEKTKNKKYTFVFGDAYGKKHLEYYRILVKYFDFLGINHFIYDPKIQRDMNKIDLVILFNKKENVNTNKPIVLIDHGASNLKWFLSDINRYNSIDYFLVSGPKHKLSMDSFFGDHGKVISAGFVKSEKIFKTPDVDLSQYKIDPSKKIILYAPTWHTVYHNDFLIIFEQLKHFDNVLYSFHPEDKISMNYTKHNVVKNVETSEILKVCDIIISDFSSILYESSVLGKKNIQILLSSYPDNPSTNYNYPVTAGYADLFVGGIPTLPQNLKNTIDNIDNYPNKLFEIIYYNLSCVSYIQKDAHEKIISKLLEISDTKKTVTHKTNKTLPLKKTTMINIKQTCIVNNFEDAKKSNNFIYDLSNIDAYADIVFNVLKYIQDNNIKLLGIMITSEQSNNDMIFALQSFGKPIIIKNYGETKDILKNTCYFMTDSQYVPLSRYTTNVSKYVEEYKKNNMNYVLENLYKKISPTANYNTILSGEKNQTDIIDMIELYFFDMTNTDCLHGLTENIQKYTLGCQFVYLYNYRNMYTGTVPFINLSRTYDSGATGATGLPDKEERINVNVNGTNKRMLLLTRTDNIICVQYSFAVYLDGSPFNYCKKGMLSVTKLNTSPEKQSQLFKLINLSIKCNRCIIVNYNGMKYYTTRKYLFNDNGKKYVILSDIMYLNRSLPYVANINSKMIIDYDDSVIFIPINDNFTQKSMKEVVLHEFPLTYNMAMIHLPEKLPDTKLPDVKLNCNLIIEGMHNNFGHRSGWKYVLKLLGNIHYNHIKQKIRVIDLIEKTFSWNTKKEVITDNWIGFWHNPHCMPLWFDSQHSPQSILDRKVFKESLNTCKGIFVLSDYFNNWLKTQINVPVSTLYHPTEDCPIKFDFDSFVDNQEKCVIQIGYWLRNMCSIGLINTTYKKIWFYGNEWARDCLKRESGQHDKCGNMDDVVFLRVSDELYDEFLSKNIGFVYVYDASANNAVIECMIRHTPLIINKHPAVVEYLGSEYPMYFNDISEVDNMLHNNKLIKQCHEYLKNNKEIQKKISGNNFIEQFAASKIIQNLESEQ